MPYITMPQSPVYHQISLEDILNGEVDVSKYVNTNETNTKTYYVKELKEEFLKKFDFDRMINQICLFNETHRDLFGKNRKSLYETFYMEKKGKGMPNVFKKMFDSQNSYVDCDSKTVCKAVADALRPLLNTHNESDHDNIFEQVSSSVLGILSANGFDVNKVNFSSMLSDSFRKINAPKQSLKDALRELKGILEGDMLASYHTSAFAYVKGRCTVDSIKRHQHNKSRWFVKLDFSDFFGSTTESFVFRQFSNIFPFSEIINNPDGKKYLKKAIGLCFLNGGLPQGTPISPTITNIMMIPIDHKICNDLRKWDEHFTYTRYADDILISSRRDFDQNKVQDYILSVLKEFKAPFSMKKEKTRYGSSAGRNWNLGVMLNKDNRITIGWKKKRIFKATCAHYITDKKNNELWDLHDVQVLSGLISYYRMIEKDYIDYIIDHYNKKFGVDMEEMIRSDLRA